MRAGAFTPGIEGMVQDMLMVTLSPAQTVETIKRTSKPVKISIFPILHPLAQ
jgi:hypothetical protein